MGSISGRYHGRHPHFVRGAFSRDAGDASCYFRSIGPNPRDEERVYPRSMQVNSVVLMLTRALERSIEVYTEKQLVVDFASVAIFVRSFPQRAAHTRSGDHFRGPAAPFGRRLEWPEADVTRSYL